jgi:CheY-like chemotaxis protein
MPKTILIIEDEIELVDLLKIRLESNGYKVETAFNGKDGLEKIKALKPDLVLLDIRLPEMNGYEVCKLAKGDYETCFIPIIIFTAYIKEKERDAKESGADSFITKPFEPEELMKEIARLLK